MRLREQLDEGRSLVSAARISGLPDELAAAHDSIAGLRARLGER
ncbi:MULTISPECIES: hypothetical protein [Amycolatopsis]|nr:MULTISPECIES: hypothetical protein [Amycolatopsis]